MANIKLNGQQLTKVKQKVIQTFIGTPEGMITVAVLRLLDDRIAVYEQDEHRWLPLVGPFTPREWDAMPPEHPFRRYDRTEPTASYEFMFATPQTYSELTHYVNHHPARHRTLRE